IAVMLVVPVRMTVSVSFIMFMVGESCALPNIQNCYETTCQEPRSLGHSSPRRKMWSTNVFCKCTIGTHEGQVTRVLSCAAGMFEKTSRIYAVRFMDWLPAT